MRRYAEWLARALVLVVLAVLLARALRPAPRRQDLASASSANLEAALVRWSTVESPASARVALDSLPSAAQRDWLGAIARSGTRVTWDATTVAALAVAATPLADPRGGSDVAAAVPRGALVRLRDGAGALDSATARARYMSWSVPTLAGEAEVLAAGASAAAPVRDSLLLRRLLVLASAGWESRFVVNALEERGWRVDALLRVAPTVNVVQGSPTAPDTARYAAVILLDSAFAEIARPIASYVRAGGGLVLAGSAPAAARLAQLRAGAPGALASADESQVADGDSSGFTPLATRYIAPRGDAVTLARDTRGVLVAARRVGRGRVLQVGYDDTWRWRMMGAREPVERHRAWWARAVRSVAYAPALARDPRSSAGLTDAAPYASLVGRLGAPTPQNRVQTAPRKGDESRSALLFAILSAALLAEVASRRLRGAP